MAKNNKQVYDSRLAKSVFNIKHQRTFCMVKPDGVMRGLVGEILRRIEKSGLRIVAMKMLVPNQEIIKKHYPASDEAWVKRLGDKGISALEGLNLDVVETYGTDDRRELGDMVVKSLIEYMQSGPCVAMVVEGVQAIDMVRKLAGSTIPSQAEMGTIRGDFSVDTPAVANVEKRAIHNIFHASENAAEAENEIKLWFAGEKIHDYSLAGDEVMYNKHY
ncbi:MAG: nucleoside-diphosphate kinase [Candidatus Nomurabacteria bacterium]|jgi:nucleoside-diphosphate kinase|nr:nucleoside-diphosphate kinase [Candidatus Nomurabacteria bacterium]